MLVYSSAQKCPITPKGTKFVFAAEGSGLQCSLYPYWQGTYCSLLELLPAEMLLPPEFRQIRFFASVIAAAAVV